MTQSDLEKISPRCGNGNCDHWVNGQVSESRCSIYNDRRKCTKSLAHVRRVKKHQKRELEKNPWRY